MEIVLPSLAPFSELTACGRSANVRLAASARMDFASTLDIAARDVPGSGRGATHHVWARAIAARVGGFTTQPRPGSGREPDGCRTSKHSGPAIRRIALETDADGRLRLLPAAAPPPAHEHPSSGPVRWRAPRPSASGYGHALPPTVVQGRATTSQSPVSSVSRSPSRSSIGRTPLGGSSMTMGIEVVAASLEHHVMPLDPVTSGVRLPLSDHPNQRSVTGVAGVTL